MRAGCAEIPKYQTVCHHTWPRLWTQPDNSTPGLFPFSSPHKHLKECPDLPSSHDNDRMGVVGNVQVQGNNIPRKSWGSRLEGRHDGLLLALPGRLIQGKRKYHSSIHKKRKRPAPRSYLPVSRSWLRRWRFLPTRCCPRTRSVLDLPLVKRWHDRKRQPYHAFRDRA